MFPKLKVGVLQEQGVRRRQEEAGKDKHLRSTTTRRLGDLWYDANGKKQSGKGDVLIATLDTGLDLTAGDIVVA